MKIGSMFSGLFTSHPKPKEAAKPETPSAAPAIAPDRLQLSKASPREIGLGAQVLAATAVQLRGQFDDNLSGAHDSRIAMRAIVQQIAAMTQDATDPQLKNMNALAAMGLKVDAGFDGSAHGNWSGQKSLTELVNTLAALPLPQAPEGQSVSKELAVKALVDTTIAINGKFDGSAAGYSAGRRTLESGMSQLHGLLADETDPTLAGVKAIVDLKVDEHFPDTMSGDVRARESLGQGLKRVADLL